MNTDNQTASQLSLEAKEILKNNDLGGYTIPTANLYPYQWNWDSAFSALGWACFDEERAWQELETLVGGQWENGMIPHILFRKNDPSYFPGPEVWQSPTEMPTSCYSQPPVLASVLLSLLERGIANQSTDINHHRRARSLFDHTHRWHRWWYTHRLDENGLIGIAHPWESGRDNSSDWDEAMSLIKVDPDLGRYQRKDTSHINAQERPLQLDYDRYLTIVKFGRDRNWFLKPQEQGNLPENPSSPSQPFWMIDHAINFILHKANQDLLRLAEILKVSVETINEIKKWIEHGEFHLEKLWNPNIASYSVLNPRTLKRGRAIGCADFLCFYAGLKKLEHENEMIDQFLKIREHVDFMVPSLSPLDQGFESQRYWRGPIWLVINYLIGIGLKNSGHTELSELLRKDSATLIRQCGFYESFQPIKKESRGKGVGGKDFSWTAAIWLAWGLEEVVKDEGGEVEEIYPVR